MTSQGLERTQNREEVFGKLKWDLSAAQDVRDLGS